MRFIFEQVRTGGDRNFGYIIADRESKVAMLIDPSYAPELLVKRCEEQNLQIKWILNTHGHADHTNGNVEAVRLTGAAVLVGPNSEVPHNRCLRDRECLAIGGIEVHILHSPGHSPDHLVLLIAQYKIAITGDQIFVGKIGGTATEEGARIQYEALERLKVEIDKDYTLWPGHDYGSRPSTSMLLEMQCNPFLRAQNWKDFWEMKNTWSAYKSKLGLL